MNQSMPNARGTDGNIWKDKLCTSAMTRNLAIAARNVCAVMILRIPMDLSAKK